MTYQQSSDGASKNIPYLPPCRVCSSTASGFHYGVNTCEGCKGFYRRSIVRTIPYPRCSEGNCPIQLEDRNSCPSCRYKKCLEVGMSRLAIKTGRYTHDKRTSDTLEIKHGSSSGSLMNTSPPICETSPATESPTSVLPHPTDSETLHLSSIVHDAFRKSFPDTTYMYEHSNKVTCLVHQQLDRMGLKTFKQVTTFALVDSLRGDRIDEVRILSSESDILEFMKTMHSSISGDMFWELPTLKPSPKQLCGAWKHGLTKVVKHMVSFAKSIPGFLDISDQDQVILIKGSRPELAALLRFKHCDNTYDANVHYDTSSKVMNFLPKQTLKMVTASCHHDQLLSSFEKKMASLDVQCPSVAALCAMSLLSPDRENLSLDGKEKVTLLQNQLVLVLTHVLNKAHPGDKTVLANYLMLLTTLRELNEYNAQALKHAHNKLIPKLDLSLQQDTSLLFS